MRINSGKTLGFGCAGCDFLINWAKNDVALRHEYSHPYTVIGHFSLIESLREEAIEKNQLTRTEAHKRSLRDMARHLIDDKSKKTIRYWREQLIPKIWNKGLVGALNKLEKSGRKLFV